MWKNKTVEIIFTINRLWWLQGKVSPVTEAPRPEDTCWWRYTSTHSWPHHWGQHPASSALTSGKHPGVYRRQSRPGDRKERKIGYLCRESKLGRPANMFVRVWTICSEYLDEREREGKTENIAQHKASQFVILRTLYGDKMEEDNMGGACSMHGERMRPPFWSTNPKGRGKFPYLACMCW